MARASSGHQAHAICWAHTTIHLSIIVPSFRAECEGGTRPASSLPDDGPGGDTSISESGSHGGDGSLQMLNTHHPLSQSSRVSHWSSRPHFGQSGPPQSTSVSWLANTHNSVVVATINLVPQVNGSAFYLAVDDAIDARCWKTDCGLARGGAIEAPAYG